MRSIILGALGAIVVVVFLKLVFDSQGGVTPEVGDDELEKALSEYRRTEKRTGMAADAPTAGTRVRKPKARTGASEDSDDSRPRDSQTFTKPAPLADNDLDEDSDFTNREITFKTRMDDANREYDRANYEGAREAALGLLEEQPKNVRMNRIVVSSSCIMGDEDIASQHYERLPPRDKRQMSRRCKRYGIEFDDLDQ